MKRRDFLKALPLIPAAFKAAVLTVAEAQVPTEPHYGPPVLTAARIEAWCDKIQKQAGRRPNTIVMGRNVWLELKRTGYLT